MGWIDDEVYVDDYDDGDRDDDDYNSIKYMWFSQLTDYMYIQWEGALMPFINNRFTKILDKHIPRKQKMGFSNHMF